MPTIPPFIPRHSLIVEQSSAKSSPIDLIRVIQGGVIVIALLFSGGAFLLRTFQERQLEALRESLIALIEELNPPTVEAMDTFDKKLTLVATLLDEHVYTSNIFTFLARATLKDVRFTSFGLSTKEDTVTLTTEAKSYMALIKQLNSFRMQPSIKSVEAESVTLGPAGTVRTVITLKVASTLLHL